MRSEKEKREKKMDLAGSVPVDSQRELNSKLESKESSETVIKK